MLADERREHESASGAESKHGEDEPTGSADVEGEEQPAVVRRTSTGRRSSVEMQRTSTGKRSPRWRRGQPREEEEKGGEGSLEELV